MIVNQKVDYGGAFTYCSSIGGKLFEPKDEATNAIVYNAAKDSFIATDAIPNVDYWIGIDDIDEEGNFKYNSDKSPIQWNNWGPANPDDHGSGEDCVNYHHNWPKKWNDRSCSYETGFICESSYGKKLFSAMHL